jgi:hypothetical protein
LLLLGVVVLAGGGWFLLSGRMMGGDPGLAANEAVGAALGVLLFIALVGVLRKK